MARVVVAGAGIGGQAVALLMSRRGHEVTVLESDASPAPAGTDAAWKDWPRRGVPQLRQIHLFHARGRNVLRDRLPDVLSALLSAGATEAPMDTPTNGDGLPADPDLVRINCRRTTYELILREVTRGDPRIRFHQGVGVAGLVAGPRPAAAVPHVRGVRTSGGDEFTADLVVDACGRASRLPAWLLPLGVHLPTRSARTASAAYTRWYRARSGTEPPVHPVNCDLGFAACVLAPADNGYFSVTFGVPAGDPGLRLLRRPECFDAAVACVPDVAESLAPDRAEAVGNVCVGGDSPNRLRRPAESDRIPVTGVVALGDAAVCTNPGYGRGVSLALHHAARLDEIFDHAGDDPVTLAADFAAVTRTELEPWYHDAVVADRVRGVIRSRALAGGATADPLSGADDDPEVRFALDLRPATQRDPVVRRRFLRRWSLLDPPCPLADDPDVRSRVDAVRRQLAGSPPSPTGPDHATLIRLMTRARAGEPVAPFPSS